MDIYQAQKAIEEDWLRNSETAHEAIEYGLAGKLADPIIFWMEEHDMPEPTPNMLRILADYMEKKANEEAKPGGEPHR